MSKFKQKASPTNSWPAAPPALLSSLTLSLTQERTQHVSTAHTLPTPSPPFSSSSYVTCAHSSSAGGACAGYLAATAAQSVSISVSCRSSAGSSASGTRTCVVVSRSRSVAVPSAIVW